MALTPGRQVGDHAGRNAAQRQLADDCERRKADSPVNAATKNESGRGGDR